MDDAGTGWPWGNSAFLESPTIIEQNLGRAIVRRAEAAGLRIAAIRRHGRRDATRRWRWFVAHSHPNREALYHGEVSDPREYLDLALDGSDGQPAPGPLVAVCAHGKHDQCCAVRGRGAVASITDEFPELIWECPHLGGERFAATMLILPEGLCYGRVDSADPPNLIRLYLAGRLHNTFPRGRTSLPHVMQAAQYFVREASHDDRIDAHLPLEIEPSGSVTRVVLQAESGSIEVVVSEQLSDPLLSKCGATVAGRVRTFALVSVKPA